MNLECPHCKETVQVGEGALSLALIMKTPILTACLNCGTEIIVEANLLVTKKE